jgi:hypothetical protein
MRPETALQRLIRGYIAAAGFRSVHVPNGAVLSGDKEKRARQMNSLKRDGLLPGFPDLIVFGKGGRIGFIEVKVEGSYQQPSQKECQRWLTELGQRYAVCRSTLDVDETLTQWGWI